MLRCGLLAIVVGLGALPVGAQGIEIEDDEPIIIEGVEPEEGEPSGDEAGEGQGDPGIDAGEDDIIILDEDDDEELIIVEDDDEIVILEEGSEEAEPPRVSGALSRLWESLDVTLDASLELRAQLVGLDDGPFRSLAGAWANTTLIPARNLSFYANAFARVAVEAPTEGLFRPIPIVDLYEAYAKINAEVGSVVIGRLVVPWGRTQVAALGDRLNPPDHRRAPQAFPDPVRLKQPQWGAQVRTSLGSVALEGVVLTLYEPSEGSLAASDQGGVRVGRYQTALVRSPSRVGGLLREYDRTDFVRRMDILDATTIGLRARQRVAGVDLGATAVWGVDQVPRLDLEEGVARYLATEAYLIEGKAPPPYPCADVPAGRCLGDGFLEHGRTASVSADVAYGLQNIVILKGEVLAHPNVGFLPGKTAHVVDERGLRSVQVGHYGAAVAVEGGYGDWVVGSLELFDLVWAGVPADARLWGVEGAAAQLLPQVVEVAGSRMVHRVGLGWSFAGSLLDRSVDWRLRGEVGVLQLDTLFSAEVRYRLPIFDLYVGSRGNLFAGWPGSPGWMRQDATLIGVFVGEGA